VTAHGILCACTVHDDAAFDDDRDGKAIARAAEVDDPTDSCD
jgi:hypothetical protein